MQENNGCRKVLKCAKNTTTKKFHLELQNNK